MCDSVYVTVIFQSLFRILAQFAPSIPNLISLAPIHLNFKRRKFSLNNGQLNYLLFAYCMNKCYGMPSKAYPVITLNASFYFHEKKNNFLNDVISATIFGIK